MNIDPETEKALAQAAALRNVSVNSLLRDFVAQETQYWKERNEDMAALQTMQAGNSISQKDMQSHFEKLREIAQERL